jgi:pantetheine-phosphate adenylyltransferase
MMMHDHVAIYPGSFDPITNGHVDLVKRTLRVFDKIVVAIATNPGKDGSLFTVPERLQMVRDVFKTLRGRVEADSFEGLLVDYAERKKATVIIRGLRAISDFEYEFQMAHMNKKLASEVDTIFMMTGERYSYISSNIVKEIASFGGKIDDLVPPLVKEEVFKKIRKRRKQRQQ